jgi:AAA15 family ATPase/GTPase
MFIAILPGENKMKPKISLSSFSLKNFKAVQDSKTIRFTQLTVFIGNNGSGKSSIVEAMKTFQSVVLNGLDEAMIPW